MLCTFCGTENRPENKFCGMCGVRLERRQADRRAQRNTNVKCSSCGNINEPGYKFCGMCGTRIERRLNDRRGNEFSEQNRTRAPGAEMASPATARRKSESAVGMAERDPAEARTSSEKPVNAFRTERSEHSIPGPSFLGLSDDPDNEGEYLLEDEGSSRRGLRTLVLLAVLAAIVGLILVQWRSSFRANPKTPEIPKTESSPQPQGQNQISPDANPNAPANPQSAQPAALTANTDPFSDGGKQLLQQAFGSAANDPRAAKTEKESSSEKDIPEGDPPAGVAAASDARISSPQPPSRLLQKAQQYLQGSGGVPQNCEQGLVYLQAATQKNDPAAAVQMGALYASGHCVKQDRVMAYRWFNSAHELEPSNQWIQQNMTGLWSQMNEEERRQAQY
jgi:Double zinc ribbon